jgi:ribosomal protein S18 acetylase RimI-like enzyme
MEIRIREIDPSSLVQVNQCDSSFIVDARLHLDMQDGEICYTVVSVPPRPKSYPPSDLDYAAFAGHPDKTIFFADVDGQLAGQIVLWKNWNRFAYIEDIRVEARYRRQGVGRRLLVQAADWAKSKGLPGLMLETQDINVPGCRLYESFGFKLGGFDRYLYRGLTPDTDEVALYWYLLF